MKPKAKQEVVDLFILHRKSPKEKYQALVQVLLKLDGATPGQKRFYNASRYSAPNLATLEYDVKKLCGISDKDLSRAVKAEKELNPPTTAKILPIEFTAVLEEIDLSKADYAKELKPLAKQISEFTEKEPESQKKVDLIAFIDSFIPKGPSTEEIEAKIISQFTEAPEVVKQGIKLREQYPFLGAEDCPDEFKILTNDMLTAFYNYRDGRKELKEALAAGATNEDIFEIAKKTVADFELNLECGDELDHYQEHGKILGTHPIFGDKMLVEKVENMGSVDLANRKKNLASYISRDTKALNKMEEGPSKAAFAEKLEGWKKEQELVIARLEKIS